MAAVTPQTDLYLLRCPLEIDQENQMTFSNATAQYNYFFNLPKRGNTDYSYQRKDSTIRYNAHIDSIRSYNYCMYRNDAYSNKWFYAFITDMEYLNDSTTLITITTDVWQTWQFDITIKTGYILREHVNNDTVGRHTYPEDLEYGEYIINAKENVGTASGMNDCYLVVSVTELLDKMYNTWGNRARIYNGLPQGTYLFALAGESYAEIYFNLKNMVRSYDKAGKSAAILTIYVVPKSICTVAEIPLSFDTDFTFSAYVIESNTSVKTIMSKTITRNSTIDGYTPKNNKCYCAPYNYLAISNNGGTRINYAWEDFSGNPSFTMRSIVNEGCDIKLTPSNYKRSDLSGGYDYSISLQKFPTVSWSSDFYLNWQAYNSQYLEIKTGLGAAAAGANMVGSMLTGNVGGMVGGALSMGQIAADAQHQITVADMTPDSAKGNSNTGDFNFTVGKTVFTAYKMSCKNEYIQLIDNFFSMFGYRVNRVGVPHVTGRRYWNYVKTGHIDIVGNIPQDDMNSIKKLFNTGITFWHDPTKYLDYSQNNAIV